MNGALPPLLNVFLHVMHFRIWREKHQLEGIIILPNVLIESSELSLAPISSFLDGGFLLRFLALFVPGFCPEIDGPLRKATEDRFG